MKLVSLHYALGWTLDHACPPRDIAEARDGILGGSNLMMIDDATRLAKGQKGTQLFIEKRR